MSDQWIIVNRWEEFQHYKNRDPRWIKMYTRLLDDEGWLELSPACKGVLLTIWLKYASTAGQLRAKSVSNTSQGPANWLPKHLGTLVDAGFITLSASKPLAHRYQPAIPEKRRVREEPPYPLNGKPGKPFKAPDTVDALACPEPLCGIVKRTRRQLLEHQANVHDDQQAWAELNQLDADLLPAIDEPVKDETR